jgi:hypothetical protein
MALWEQVLLGIAAFVIVFLFWPGAKKAMEQSKHVEGITSVKVHHQPGG